MAEKQRPSYDFDFSLKGPLVEHGKTSQTLKSIGLSFKERNQNLRTVQINVSGQQLTDKQFKVGLAKEIYAI